MTEEPSPETTADTPAVGPSGVPPSGFPVTVATNPFAAWLLKYFWVPVLLYVVLAIAQGLATGLWQTPFQWSFVPAHLLGFGVASHLLRRTTPRLLQRLVDTGALSTDQARQTGATLTRRMNGPGCEIFSAAMALAFVPFSFPDVLLAYLLGQVIWKSCAVGLTIHQLGSREQLRLRPFHADGCAGLASIGELCFGASLVLIVSGTFLSFWLVYAGWIDPSVAEEPLFRLTRPFFYGGLITVALCTVLVFLAPMWSTHRLMSRRAQELNGRYDHIANELAEREESLLVEGPAMPRDDFLRECERIQVLRAILEQGRRIPRWPIPLQTKLRFVAAQIPMGLGLAASIQQLSELALTTAPK